MTALREFLGLARADSDWAVMGLLSCVESCVDLWPCLPVMPDFTAATWVPPADTWVGGTLVPDAQGPPLTVDTPTNWPADTQWQLVWNSPTTAVLRGTYRQYEMPASAAGLTLVVDWPPELGWRGHVQLASTWETAQVYITHWPNYPAAAVAAALPDRPEFAAVMAAGRMLEAWHVVDEPTRKLAALGVALIRLAGGLPYTATVSEPPPAARDTQPPTNS